MKKRASEEVNNLIAKLMAEADALKAKYAESDMPPEDVQKLADLVSQLEALEAEKAEAEASERIEAMKLRMSEPARPAPKVQPGYRDRMTTPVSAGEALGLWMGSFGPNADRSPEATTRARTAGVDLGNPIINVPVSYDGLNRKNRSKSRTILSKGGSNTGADYVWQSYSDKVVSYLTYFSPLLGMLDSETTADGNLRSYFVVDNTSMESAYITASSGTETNPTIAETNLATAVVQIGCFDITSGFQKVTFQELRDSYINLEDKIAKANSNSHARKLEREILTATGNGTTGVKGITASCTSAGTPATWTQDDILTALMSIPAQYRKEVIFCSNDTVRNAINVALRDDIGRSLFDKTVEDDQEFDVLLGHKYVVSSYVADDVLLIFNPTFYKLRLVQGQMFQQFTERFWPHSAWAGMMSFGGSWVGPSTAAKKLTRTDP